ncbi:MAG: carboxypeptidase regulatory-like domain-containing protein, partial [Vicinamibacterales bacterium]
MKILRATAMLLLLSLVATGAAAQGKVAGKTVDGEGGQPLADVQVKGTVPGQAQPVTAKSNKKGEFALSGIAAGEWTLEFTKEGFDPQSGKITIESGKSADITVKLVKHVDRPDPGVELNAKAQEGMALMQGQKYAEARKIFEEMLVKFPDVHQLNAYIAQSYAGENNMPKAIEYMKAASEKDPENAEMKLVLADLMMEGGDKTAAVEMMKTVDLTKIKNPLPLING